MRMRLIATAVAGLLLAGCTGADDTNGEASPKDTNPCSLEVMNRPPEVVTEPAVSEQSEPDSNIALDVSSSSTKPVRIQVRFDGELALDIRAPGTSAECSHSPVYSHEYRLPGPRTKVTVETDRNQRGTEVVDMTRSPKQWVVVQVQDGFPLDVRSFQDEVFWG